MTLLARLEKKVLLGDGSMGGYSLAKAKEAGFSIARDFLGCENLPDILSVTHPEFVKAIHLEYLKAGADLIQTNTFNANALYFRSYHRALEDQAYGVNFMAAQIAREAVEMVEDASRDLFVVGTIGPGNFELGKTDLGTKHDFLFQAYCEQAQALVDGGVDACLIETCTEIVQIQAAVEAVQHVCRKTEGKALPIFVTAVFSEQGMTWRNHSVLDLVKALAPYAVDAFGLNCMPAENVGATLSVLASQWPRLTICQPNGGGDLTQVLRTAVVEKGANLIGGCCKTTPSDIQALDAMLREIEPGKRRPAPARQRLALNP